MIKTETIIIDSQSFKRTYSSNNKQIRNTATLEIYNEAIDLLGSSKTYIETSTDIPANDIQP